jgi:hypothetical protein
MNAWTIPKKTTLQWMAPGLAKAGLITNEPWCYPASVEADLLFTAAGDQEDRVWRNAAVAMAVVHPWGLQTLKQAPVLASGFAVAAQKGNEAAVNYLYGEQGWCDLARLWRDALNTKPKLRALMASVGLPYGLRNLSPKVIVQSSSIRQDGVLKALRAAGESHLAQTLPEIPDVQRKWLHGLGHWVLAAEQMRLEPAHFEWAMQHAAHPIVGGYNFRALADFAHSEEGGFNPRWGVEKAAAAMTHWHNQKVNRDFSERFYAKFGVDYEEVIPFNDQLRHTYTIDYRSRRSTSAYTFIRLMSGRAMVEEREVMHHCIGRLDMPYIRNMVSGERQYWSMRDWRTEKRLATLEFTPEHYAREEAVYPDGVEPFRFVSDEEAIKPPDMTMMVKQVGMAKFKLTQGVGPCNNSLSGSLLAAVDEFRRLIEEHYRVDARTLGNLPDQRRMRAEQFQQAANWLGNVLNAPAPFVRRPELYAEQLRRLGLTEAQFPQDGPIPHR